MRDDPRLVLDGALTASGSEFCRWLARFAVASTAADAAYVAVRVGASRDRLRILAAAGAVDVGEDDEIAVAGSLGEVALSGGDGPGSPHGVALCVRSSAGHPLGVIAAGSQAPLAPDERSVIEEILAAMQPRLTTVLRSQRDWRELKAMRDVNEAESGEEILNRLVRTLSDELGVKAAFVSDLTDAEHGLARSLALVVDRKLLPRMNYATAGTPTGATFDEGELLVESGICARYPNLGFLAGLDADGYFATTLRCPHGKPIASIGLIHDAPLAPDLADSALFRLCATQARAEVLRLRAQDRRIDLERELLAAQRAESLGRLAGGLAHDFRNILSAVVGNADLAAAELPLDSALHGRLEGIRSASERAALLCEQLLIYAGKGSLTRRVLDVNHLIEDLGELLGVSLGSRCDLALNLADGLPAVEADPAQLQQLIMNLLSNASEAMSGSGGSVSIRTDTVSAIPGPGATSLRPAEPHDGEHVVVEVRDEGAGISEQAMERVFEPFYSTKAGATGRGLGLAAVAGIVRAHDGAVALESRVGEGTTVRVYLPTSPLTAPPRGWPRNPRPHAAVTTTVLVVDDEPTVRAVAEAMLVQGGFEVLLAADGEQALSIVERRGDDLGCIVLDLVMPIIDGARVIETLRERGSRIPVVVSSGFPTSFLADRFPADSVAALLAKPYTAQQLVETVDSVLVGADA